MSKRKIAGLGRWLMVLMSVAVWPVHLSADQTPTAAELVERADRFRQPFTGADLKVRLTSYRDGERHDERNYHVWADGSRRSLVAMLDPKVRGQKVLMLPEGMWLHMPSSRRALRITPMQRLMGQASYGDIAQLQMAGLYSAAFDQASSETEVDGTAVWQLNLTAADDNVTYARIDLSVARDDGRPVAAKFYLRSGKLLKRAIYGPVEASAHGLLISQVTYFDALRANRKTVMTLHAIRQKDFTGADFSVRGLARWQP